MSFECASSRGRERRLRCFDQARRQVAIRLRDLKSEKRAAFTGLTYYPISTAHRIAATFIPHATPKTIPILNVIGQMIDMESPGVVAFTLNGRKLQLDAVYEDERRLDLS